MNGTVIDRTIVSQSICSGTIDLRVGILNDEISASDVSPMKILPKNYREYLPNITDFRSGVTQGDANSVGYYANFPVIVSNQFAELYVSDIQRIGNNTFDVETIYTNTPSGSKRIEFSKSVVLNDSGSPVFVVVNGQTVILSIVQQSAPPLFAGEFIADKVDGINYTINEMGGTDQVEIVSLGNFINYASGSS
jgi:hypothetical protein